MPECSLSKLYQNCTGSLNGPITQQNPSFYASTGGRPSKDKSTNVQATPDQVQAGGSAKENAGKKTPINAMDNPFDDEA